MEEIKSSSGYFSVIDMFAVLLPGVLLVGGLNTLGAWSLLSEGLPKDEAAAWLSFGVEAYVAGHFIFILASGLDGPLYHRLLRHALDHDDGLSYRLASALKARYFGERLGAVDRLHPMNTFAWAKTVMALRAPRALAEVQRFEADSKFFRSLTLLMPALGVIALHRVGWSGVAGPAVIGATAALTVLACWRYGERRLKSTQWAYNYVITLFGAATPEVGAAVDDAPSAGRARRPADAKPRSPGTAG